MKFCRTIINNLCQQKFLNLFVVFRMYFQFVLCSILQFLYRWQIWRYKLMAHVREGGGWCTFYLHFKVNGRFWIIWNMLCGKFKLLTQFHTKLSPINLNNLQLVSFLWRELQIFLKLFRQLSYVSLRNSKHSKKSKLLQTKNYRKKQMDF